MRKRANNKSIGRSADTRARVVCSCPTLRSEKGGWEITFCGFVLILLAFFIMLSSFATMEEAKVTQFVRSFSQAVSILSGGLKFGQRKDILMESADITDDRDILSALEKVVKGLTLNTEVRFSKNKGDLVMTLPDTVIFDSGEAELTPEAIPLLHKIGVVISEMPYPVRIEGHTDNMPINTQRFPSNWELSTARAVNVLRYYVEQEKISSEKISAVGYGEFHPLYPNDNAEQRTKNRRVEIVFVGAERDSYLEGIRE
jgi:chemotaxis protein MotB